MREWAVLGRGVSTEDRAVLSLNSVSCFYTTYSKSFLYDLKITSSFRIYGKGAIFR